LRLFRADRPSPNWEAFCTGARREIKITVDLRRTLGSVDRRISQSTQNVQDMPLATSRSMMGVQFRIAAGGFSAPALTVA
jgi:hypothetical protein